MVSTLGWEIGGEVETFCFSKGSLLALQTYFLINSSMRIVQIFSSINSLHILRALQNHHFLMNTF